MGVLWEYVERYGRPTEVYTDKDSMFAIPRQPDESAEQRRQANPVGSRVRAGQ
jgi:hypothetical protein